MTRSLIVIAALLLMGFSSAPIEQPVTVHGYNGSLMEPEVSGNMLFFNSEGPNADIYLASRINDYNYQLVGKVVATPSFDGAASVSDAGDFCFSSGSNYPPWIIICNGAPLIGDFLTEPRPPMTNMDTDISADGQRHYIVISKHDTDPPSESNLFQAQKQPDGSFNIVPDIFQNINTSNLEYAADILPGELMIFFTRMVGRDATIWRAIRSAIDQPFSMPSVVVDNGFSEGSTDNGCLYHKRVGSGFKLFRRC